MAGFFPALAIILLVGYGIIKMGVKLPLKKVFAVTNAILLYLAFVMLGKGFYNLQEAGVFAPHPIRWIPYYSALRQVFGLFPLVETVVAQAALICLVTATFILTDADGAHAGSGSAGLNFAR